MLPIRLAPLVLALLCAVGCSSNETLDETGVMLVTLPDGFKVKAEMLTHPKDMMRGMMFRDSLPPDRGLLFIHGSEGRYGYWMYQVKVPLDIIWMSANRTVVEISENTPPCQSTSAQKCPSYGGNVNSVYVLELAAGSAAKHGVRNGTALSF